MMTQLPYQTIWKWCLLAMVVWAWFGLLPTLANAATEINVICDDQACNTDSTTSNELWAPGSLFQRKIQIYNQAAKARSIVAKMVLANDQESAVTMLATWRNGSRRLLWQGSLAQSINQVLLGQVAAHESRIYWLDVSLPKTAGNTLQQTTVNFEPIIMLSEDAPNRLRLMQVRPQLKKLPRRVCWDKLFTTLTFCCPISTD